MEALIRPAVIADMDRVGEIMVDGFRDQFDRVFGPQADQASDVMKKLCLLWLERGMTVQFVAEADGQVIGMMHIAGREERLGDLWAQVRLTLKELGLFNTLRCVVGLTLPHEAESADTAYVSDLAVDAAFRNQGLGSALLARSEAWAREQGRAALSLHVTGINPARRLYERFGFRERKRYDDWLSWQLLGVRTWVYMVKPLEKP